MVSHNNKVVRHDNPLYNQQTVQHKNNVPKLIFPNYYLTQYNWNFTWNCWSFDWHFRTTFIADIKRFEHKNTIRGFARTGGRGAGGKLAQNNAKEVTTISRAKGTTLAQCLFVQLNNGLISGRAQSREVFVQYSIIRLPLNKTVPHGRVHCDRDDVCVTMCYNRTLSSVRIFLGTVRFLKTIWYLKSHNVILSIRVYLMKNFTFILLEEKEVKLKHCKGLNMISSQTIESSNALRSWLFLPMTKNVISCSIQF